MPNINGYHIEGEFPAVITPDNRLDYQEFLASLKDNKSRIHELLLKHGALLFRGFPVKSPADFASVIETIGLGQFVNYIGGDSPRDRVEQKVYTSTEAPPSLLIPLHQELSYIKYHPKNIYFYCQIAAPVGGATIIGDIRRITRAIDKDVLRRFNENGLLYTSRYYSKSKLMKFLNKYQRSHKSWMEVFETTNREDVEKKCVENEFAWRWLPNEWIEIQQTRPAMTTHPQTGENVWFNQAHLYDFNPKLLGLKNYLGAKLLYMRRNMLLHEIAFADGSPVPRKDLYHILDVLNENTVNYPWQSGDVMVLDNILAMHGREPFQGKRRVLTALTT